MWNFPLLLFTSRTVQWTWFIWFPTHHQMEHHLQMCNVWRQFDLLYIHHWTLDVLVPKIKQSPHHCNSYVKSGTFHPALEVKLYNSVRDLKITKIEPFSIPSLACPPPLKYWQTVLCPGLNFTFAWKLTSLFYYPIQIHLHCAMLNTSNIHLHCYFMIVSP